MKEMILSKRAEVWTKDKNIKICGVASVFFDGNNASVVCNTNAKVKNLSFKINRRGIGNFCLPVSLLDIQCSDGLTYGDVFKEYLYDILNKIRPCFGDGKVLVAFIIPEREIWQRDMEKYLSYIEPVFDISDKNFAPLLIPMRSVIDVNVLGKGTLFISIEREWTDFILKKKDGSLINTSAHIGASQETNLEKPVHLRMNDFIRNSTLKWKDFTAENWLYAFLEILSRLQKNGWNEIKDIRIICPEERIWNILVHTLSARSFHVYREGYKALDAAESVRNYLFCKASPDAPSKKVKPIKKTDENTVKKKEDLWTL